MYEGPGMYQHYKGGHYLVLGTGAEEATGKRHVVYMSMDKFHQHERMIEREATFVLRPLTEMDKNPSNEEERAFNEICDNGDDRFVKIADWA